MTDLGFLMLFNWILLTFHSSRLGYSSKCNENRQMPTATPSSAKVGKLPQLWQSKTATAAGSGSPQKDKYPLKSRKLLNLAARLQPNRLTH